MLEYSLYIYWGSIMNKLLILVVLLLVGCGGGGGSSTTPSNTPLPDINSSQEQNTTLDKSNTSMKERGFGALFTPQEILDTIPIAYPPSGSSVNTLPSSVDLSPHMPPVGDQGAQNSCVGWAVGYYLKSYHEHREHNQAYGLGGDYTHRYSPAFVYNMSKIGSCESGAYLLDALLLLKDTGVAPWEDAPYDQAQCDTPSFEAIEKAQCAKIENIKRLDIHSRHFVSNIRYFLYQNEPIAITLKPYESFINPKLYDGEYWYREFTSNELSPTFLHSVLIVGYDDRRRAFKIINSWGVEWGNDGYLWIDYNLLEQITVEAFWVEDAISPCIIENFQIKEIETSQQENDTLDIVDEPVELSITDNIEGIAGAELINQKWVANTITFVFQFSKNVVGFESSDIIVNNAIKSNFRGEGSLYYLDLTPPLHSTETILISIGANSAFDSYGNGNQEANHNQEVNTIKPFITRWDTTEVGTTNSEQIKIGTNSNYSYNYRVDWGDGEESTNVRGDTLHTYKYEGVYSVSITGKFPAIYFEREGYDSGKLLSIEQWGTQSWQSMHKAFYNTINMVGNFHDTPNLQSVQDMSYMFANTYHFNSDIGHWDVSSVTDMSSMFSNARAFNQNIVNWDVLNVKNMNYMFAFASAFNQNINSWNVSNVTLMQGMFYGASQFNQNLNLWNVSSVIDMVGMFHEARSFNQDIGNWNTSNVQSMAYMFFDADAFNQNISNWNTSKVERMSYMFNGADTFNQDISSWDISNVNAMDGILENTNFSTYYYNKILDRWSQLTLQRNVAFGVKDVKYNIKYADKRQYIIDTFNWKISDGGVTNE